MSPVHNTCISTGYIPSNIKPYGSSSTQSFLPCILTYIINSSSSTLIASVQQINITRSATFVSPSYRPTQVPSTVPYFSQGMLPSKDATDFFT